jgi:hypothetical protein
VECPKCAATLKEGKCMKCGYSEPVKKKETKLKVSEDDKAMIEEMNMAFGKKEPEMTKVMTKPMTKVMPKKKK